MGGLENIQKDCEEVIIESTKSNPSNSTNEKSKFLTETDFFSNKTIDILNSSLALGDNFILDNVEKTEPLLEQLAKCRNVKNADQVLSYLKIDLNNDPEKIAEKMIEGINIPGIGQPIQVDSSSLPKGWKKYVFQRDIGVRKGKWEVSITNQNYSRLFRTKVNLQKY